MQTTNRKASVGYGMRTVLISLFLLILLVGINLLVSMLPRNLTLLDTSYNALYTLSQTTKSNLSAVSEDISIYFLCSDGTEDSAILTFLQRYAAENSHITIKTVNTTENSTFTAAYTDVQLPNYSVIVESKRRSVIIDYYDLYLWEDTQLGLGIMTSEQYASMLSGSSGYLFEIYPPTQHFNGESKITNAISYVTSQNVPKIYAISAHGETSIGSDFRSTIKASSYDLVEGFSLLANGGIPQDCDMLFLYAPATDLTRDEATWILDYLNKGGNLFLVTAIGKQYSDMEVKKTDENGIETVTVDPSDFPNLMSVLKAAGLSALNGVIVETDSGMTLSSNNTMLLPKATADHSATTVAKGNTLLLPAAHGISVDPNAKNATILFSTSDKAYTVSVGSSDITQKDEYSLDGPFAVAVHASMGEGALVWYSSGTFITDYYDTLVSGGNHAYAIAAFHAMNAQESAIVLPSVSLEEPKLVVTDQTATVFGAFFCGIIPLSILIGGIAFRRKRLRA